MNISYDTRVDALYIKLRTGDHKVQSRQVDEDIALDFDEVDHLVGIEVLDASRRLELQELFPVTGSSSEYTRSPDGSGPNWEKLVAELTRRKEAGEPIFTVIRPSKNWVGEVAADYVRLRRDRSGNPCTITRHDFEHMSEDSLRRQRKWSITLALRQLLSAL